MLGQRAWVLIFAVSASASASPDVFALGDGHRGALVVGDAGTVINAFGTLATDADAGQAIVQLTTNPGVAPGDLLLFFHAVGFPGPDSGTPGPFDLGPTPVGVWELARVELVQANQLTLSDVLVNSFPAAESEVVVVPEYTNVSIQAGASLVAPPWDGSTGGVVALLATGTLDNAGAISASGAGFRGGQLADSPGGGNCTGLDEPPPQGAQKGEGVVLGGYGPSTTGYGNLVNGGGGGICLNAGGGGGGNAGAGGNGGFTAGTDSTRDVGGRGGGALQFPGDRLTLGGGGGAGQENNDAGSAGAAGGGVVFVRARALTGAGLITADGDSASQTSLQGSASDGAGGGGAGGTLYLRFAGSASCGLASAAGGNGGNTLEVAYPGPCGPGGGGGGGFAFVQGNPLACPVSVSNGIAGTTPDSGSYGAGPVDGGDPLSSGTVTTFPGGFDAGAVVAVLVPPAQTIDAGEAATLDGRASSGPARSPLSFVWAEPAGPTGVRLAPDAGFQSLTLTAPGDYRFRLRVIDSFGEVSAPVEATIHVNGDSPAPRTVLSCGCRQAPELGILPLLFAWIGWGWIARRRRRATA